MRPAAVSAGGKERQVFKPHLPGLADQLGHRLHIAQAAPAAGGPVPHNIGPVAAGQLPGQLFHIGAALLRRHGAQVMGLRPQQMVEQHITLHVSGFVPIMDQDALQPRLGAGRRRQSTQVGLQRTGGQNHVGFLLSRLPQKKFQASQLVSSGPQAGHIVPLDV